MTTNPLSCTVHDNVRAMLNGTDQIAWNSFVSGLNHGENGDKPTSHAKRIVNDQRDLVIVCDLHGALITERITNIFFQTFAISRIGLTLYLGFPMVSTNTALVDRKSTRLNSSHLARSRMPSSA